VVRTLVVLNMVPVNVWRISRWYERPLC